VRDQRVLSQTWSSERRAVAGGQFWPKREHRPPREPGNITKKEPPQLRGAPAQAKGLPSARDRSRMAETAQPTPFTRAWPRSRGAQLLIAGGSSR
jgi:hypothetical protein